NLDGLFHFTLIAHIVSVKQKRTSNEALVLLLCLWKNFNELFFIAPIQYLRLSYVAAPPQKRVQR
ncbi:MAG: hypothetical protein J6Q57_07580, partial [Paraprevotella sp.]|nr:hypothetical protein [Paraprevotella sp.]